MANAFILIKVEDIEPVEIIEKLEAIPEFKEVYLIHGMYELLTRIETESMQNIQEHVDEIEKMEGVGSSLTLIIIEQQAASDEASENSSPLSSMF